MGFDPLSMGLMAAGGIVSAIGSHNQGVAGRNAAAYRAQVARNNALIAEQNAEWAQQQGNALESAQGMKTRAGIGKLRTQMAASGVDVSSGSFSDVLDSAAALAELDALTIRSNTARKVYGYKVEAGNQEASARLNEAEGEASEAAGDIGALSSLLSSASTVSGRYAAWQRTAGPG